MEVFAVDVLHTLDQGILQRLFGTCFWKFAQHNVFVGPETEALMTKESLIQMHLHALRGELVYPILLPLHMRV